MLNNPIIASFSGGLTSAMMVRKMLLELECKPTFHYVPCFITKYGHLLFVCFTNTGKEREETLKFVKDCDDNFGFQTVWLQAIITNKKGIGPKAKIVSFYTCARKGEPFEAMIQKLGVPNAARSKCSSELKTAVVRAFARQIKLKKYWNAVGIRKDEPKRLNWEKAVKERVFYPLATMWRANKSVVRFFWSQQSFTLMLKSYEGNCDLCWKKSMRKLMTIAKEHPELTGWWNEMEEKYGYYVAEDHNIPDEQLPRTFFRKYMSMQEIIEESKFPFDLALDENQDIDADHLLEWSEELDSNNGCVESCEAF